MNRNDQVAAVCDDVTMCDVHCFCCTMTYTCVPERDDAYRATMYTMCVLFRTIVRSRDRIVHNSILQSISLVYSVPCIPCHATMFTMPLYTLYISVY